jgi:hypothetical protein
LREEAGLHLPGDFQFLRGTALRFELVGNPAAMFFDFATYLIDAYEEKRVSIRVAELGKDSAPDRRLALGRRQCGSGGRSRESAFIGDTSQARREEKPNSTPAPFFLRGNHVLGYENYAGLPADEPVVPGFRGRRDESEDRRPILRRNGKPSLAGLKARIEGQTEAELVHIEAQALLLIPDENVDGVDAEIGTVRVGWDGGHWSDYTACILRSGGE